MASHVQNVRSRRLAAELRQFRDAAGLTWDVVAERMGWSPSKVYRIENDKVSVLLRDVGRLLDLYDVAGEHREAVLELARQARRKDWWHQYSGAIPQWFQFYVGLEAEASAMRCYESEFVPGILQTEEYARAVMTAYPEMSDKDIDQALAVRLGRQRLLAEDEPLALWFVLNEAALRRQVGGQAVMRAQLARLADLAGQRHITVQVLPFAAGAHPAMEGAFSIIEFPEDAHPDVVYMEVQGGALYLERAAELRKGSLIFDHLLAQALHPAESQAMIARLAKEP